MVTRDLDEQQRARWSFTGPSATLHLSPWREPSTLASSLVSADPARVETDAGTTREATGRPAASKDHASPRPPAASRLGEVPSHLREIMGLVEQEPSAAGHDARQPTGQARPAGDTETTLASGQEVASMRPPSRPTMALPPPDSSQQPLQPMARRSRPGNPSAAAAQLVRGIVLVMITIYLLGWIFGR